METTSLSLLESLKQGTDAPKWDRFVTLYRSLLLRWAISQKFSSQDAEDLTQEVFVKLFTEIPKYEKAPGGSFRSWLFRLCVNTGHDYRRRVATRKYPDAAGLSAVEQTTPLKEMEELEYLRELSRQALEMIRPEFTQQTIAAFHLCKVEGRPASDVSAQLGISPNAVYLSVNRIMTRLREVLAGLID